MKILVVGGAGFIGSHMVLSLAQAGYHPVVLDNLCRGYQDAVLAGELIVGDMGNSDLLSAIFTQHQIAAVLHFASFIEVAESLREPARYYENNVCQSLLLLKTMLKHGVNKIIYSSSAAVYGASTNRLIHEGHPLQPLNPYGHSKAMVETMIQDFGLSHGLEYVILRYFNAAGADPYGRLGERHQPETHLIPLILKVAAGERSAITIYGSNYPTPDGTCIRDYIHVVDICRAHNFALQRLQAAPTRLICNIGTGRGYSVYDVLMEARKICKSNIPALITDKREGDPPLLVADVAYAAKALGWKAQLTDLSAMIQHAWQFRQKSSMVEEIVINSG